jgi:hypothetical protein
MSSYTFPNIAVSDRSKDLEYHKCWGLAIVSNTFTDSWVTNYTKLQMLSSLYQVGTGSELTSYLQTNPDGSASPAIWTSLNTIKSRLRVLLGELEERGYIIKARALNSEAESRKLEEKERLRIKRKLQDVRIEAEQLSGLPLESQEYVPQSDEELKEYIDLTWKDKNVLIIEAALKWIAKRTNWDERRKRLFLNTLWANRAIVRNDIVRGIPQPFEIDPLRFIFDPNSTDDLLSDSTYFGEVEYMPLAAAAERYGLSEDELKEAYNSYQAYLGLGNRNDSEFHSSWGAMPGQCLRWFKVEDGTPRCLVIRAVWRDYKTLSHKYEENEKGKFLQDMTGEKVRERDKDKIKTDKIQCWRQATIIGGNIVKEWGECPNQPTSTDSLEVTEPPYIVWVPEFLNGKDVSMVEQLATPQLLKDIALYKLQLEQAKAIGRVLVLDMAMFPEGMTKEQVISYMKSEGVVFVNSKEYQLGTGNMNLFKDYDLGLSQSIAQQVAYIDYLDRQIDGMTGINAERQGQVAGSSQAVGVFQSAISQGNLITAPYFRGFERFCSRVLNHQAKLVKIAWADKEKFAPIIGDVGINFLKDNIDISLDEFDVIVESLPPIAQDRQMVQQLVMTAVQTGELPISDALSILIETDLTVAIRKFQRKYALRQIMMNQQEQQMSQQEQQMQMQQMELQNQQAQGNWQNQLQLQQLKNQGNIQKTALTGRVKLRSQQVDLLKR